MLEIPTIAIEDVRGDKVRIKLADMMTAFIDHGVTILGLGIPEIAAFRRIYMAKGGPEPITEATIKRVLE